MADSLIDFGEIARLAQNNVQNAISMGWLMQRDEQNDIRQQRADLAEQSMKQTVMMNLHKLGQDPVILNTPGAKAQIYAQIGKIADAPALNMENINAGDKAKDQYIAGLVSGNRPQMVQGLHGLLLTAQPDEVEKIQRATTGMEKLHEDIEKFQAWKTENADKVAALEEKNARVNVSKPLYTAVSAEFRDALRGTDTQQFKGWQTVQDSVPDKDLSGHYGVFGGRAGALSLKAGAEANKYQAEVQQSVKLLEDSEKGIPLPTGMTPAQLRAQIEVGGTLGGAYRTLEEWYQRPLDKQKLAAARAAARTVESRRLQIEALDNNTDAERLAMQREAMDTKNALDLRKQDVDESKQRFDERKEEQKTGYQRKLATAQSTLLRKYGENASASQIATVANAHGVTVSDLVHGMPMTIGQRGSGSSSESSSAEPTKLTAEQEQAKRALHIVDSFIDVVQKNPGVVGRPAQAGTAVAGAGQQLRALVNMDPVGTRFLNTKARDEAEALYELASYSVARVMDPKGAMDLKVVEAAKDALGPLNSFTSGPQQMLNKANRLKQEFAAKYGLESPSAGGSDGPSFARVTSDADYNRLPSGTVFVGPDGKQRRKP